MKILKKILGSVVLVLVMAPVALAADDVNIDNVSDSARGDEAGTLLPYTPYDDIADCERIALWVNMNIAKAREVIAARSEVTLEGFPTNIFANDILGCAIQTGDVKLWMVPFYIRFSLEFILGISGLLIVGGIIYGGYLYLFAGLTEEKEKGKNAIKNAIIGLVIAMTAWAIVNIVIQFVTG